MAYGNPKFSGLGRVLTNVALECSRISLCSPHRGAQGGNEYLCTLLEKLTLTSTQLPGDAIQRASWQKDAYRKTRKGEYSFIHSFYGGLGSLLGEYAKRCRRKPGPSNVG